MLLAGNLLLRCDLLILGDFVDLRRRPVEKLTVITLDLTTTLNDCNELIWLAGEKRYVRNETKGHIYFIRFVDLAGLLHLGKPSLTTEESREIDWLKALGNKHLVEARDLMNLYKRSTSHWVKELETAESMLNDFACYTPISVEEKRAVWVAISRELRGTGHLYTCQNRHPFTIGECSMPMEETRCSECGAAVGGTDH